MTNKLTTEIFIERARKVHGDRYDYSKVEYVDSATKVCIICKEHGEFWQNPRSHMNGYGCLLCGQSKTRESKVVGFDEFLKLVKGVHNIDYKYHPSTYKGLSRKTKISCPIHGDFWQKATNHLAGMGCPQCGRVSMKAKQSLSYEEFMARAAEVHGNQYEYVRESYVSVSKNVQIVCPVHGIFEQLASSHLKGHGCKLCSKERYVEFTKEQCLEIASKCCSSGEFYHKHHEVAKTAKRNGWYEECSSLFLPLYSKEECLKIAQTCDARKEFYTKHPKVAKWAKENGWYEECCAHMGAKGNKLRLIYAYEFPEYNSVYVGLTYMMSVRDKRHHREGAVFEFAQAKGCIIPTPKILTDLIPQEEASIQEGVWEQKYIDEGWIALNRAKTGSIGGQDKLDYSLETIEQSMTGYETLTEWASRYSQYRTFLKNNGLEDIIDKHFPNRIRQIYDDYDECKRAYQQCEYESEVKNRYPGAVAAATRHGWHDELKEICKKNHIQATREKYKQAIQSCEYLQEFHEKFSNFYSDIRKKGWNYLLKPLKRKVHSDYNFTLEEIKQICSAYSSRKELNEHRPDIIGYCRYKGFDLFKLNGWKNPNCSPVRLIKGDNVYEFETQKEACIFAGVDFRKIKKRIDSGKEYHGFLWQSINDDNKRSI